MLDNKQLKKVRIFSGIQPSGQLTIANYIGAISQWIKLQSDYDCLFSIVDYHAITVKQKPEILRKRIREIAKIYLAFGVDIKKAIIFQQSRISEHTELAWIFNCYGARISDLNKMTQFKDKAGKNKMTVSVGLYDYPVLMAADILLYDTDIVPVGEDQQQHVELARTIAKRFNNDFGNIFKIPRALVNKEGARIMSLQNPYKKMSKSDSNQNAFISLLDSPELAQKKIKKAITDSDNIISYDLKNKPAISNLLNIYSILANKNINELVKNYKGQAYGRFKQDLAELVASFLQDFQKKYDNISDYEINKVLENGQEQVKKMAQKKLAVVKKVIGVN